MIITRAPLRITLGGGGTDLPSYADRFGGFTLSAAIDKYVYVSVMTPFTPGIYLKYTQQEQVERIEQVQHPIIREALRMCGARPQIEITTLADIPYGTGLGSSGSFTTALLQALRLHLGQVTLARHELAEDAFDLEAGHLLRPVGRQDQYSAAFGGIRAFSHTADGVQQMDALSGGQFLLNHLALFFTGFTRSATTVLEVQRQLTFRDDGEMLENLHEVKAIGEKSYTALVNQCYDDFGDLLNDQWTLKRRRPGGTTNPQIEAWREVGMNAGAIGGKLVGAGGGGFLLFYTRDRARLQTAMAQAGLPEVPFTFDYQGTKVIV